MDKLPKQIGFRNDNSNGIGNTEPGTGRAGSIVDMTAPQHYQQPQTTYMTSHASMMAPDAMYHYLSHAAMVASDHYTQHNQYQQHSSSSNLWSTQSLMTPPPCIAQQTINNSASFSSNITGTNNLVNSAASFPKVEQRSPAGKLILNCF